MDFLGWKKSDFCSFMQKFLYDEKTFLLPKNAQWAKGMWSVNLRCPNFESKALLNSFWTLFWAY